MYFNRKHRHSERGVTLLETLISSGVGVVVLGAIMTMSFYTSRSFSSMDNLTKMDMEGRIALDKMTREIRAARRLEALTPTNMVFNLDTGGPLEYVFFNESEELRQIKGSEVSVLLEGCKAVRFDAFQRNSLSGTFNQFPNIALTNDAKVIQVSWRCVRDILGAEESVVDVQSAKIVVRSSK